MSSEIKFRLWLPAIKSMTYAHTIEDLMTWNNGKSVDIKGAEWLQFTGLRDKNGTEIYEGDFCHVINPMGDIDSPCIVQWSDEWSCYPYEPEDGYGDFDISSIGWARGMGYRFSVIGNIYEHPELLRSDPNASVD